MKPRGQRVNGYVIKWKFNNTKTKHKTKSRSNIKAVKLGIVTFWKLDSPGVSILVCIICCAVDE